MRSVSTSMMRDAQCTIERTQLARIEEDGTDSVRDRWFNPWRIPVTQQAQNLVRHVLVELQEYERQYQVRKRRRRETDQHIFEETVTAVVSDVACHWLMELSGGISISRSKRLLSRRSRYRPTAYSKILPGILDLLAEEEMRIITQDLGHRGYFSKGKLTTIKAGDVLVRMLDDAGLDLSHFGVHPGQEVIHLKRPKEDHWDDGELIEYEDTPETIVLREQVRAINEWLQAAEIDFDECSSPEGKPVNPHDRHLRRVFTQGRFDSGGRLFGGFWQPLSKKQRLEDVAIDGEDVVELDYGQMNPRLLYALCGEQPPEQDAYDIPGYSMHREGVKKIMNAMIFATKRLVRMPHGVRKRFAECHSIERVMQAIEITHPAIKDAFFKGLGHDLQFMESQIMVNVLLSLRGLGIIALPIHDSVIVKKSKIEVVKDIMHTCFFENTGIHGLVDC